jgi:hypothetical protein
MMTANDIFNELKAAPHSIPMLKPPSNPCSPAVTDVELYSREFQTIRVRVMSVDAMTGLIPPRRRAVETLSLWCRGIQDAFPHKVIPPKEEIHRFFKEHEWAR